MTFVILNILVWLGPFFLSLRKGKIHTLHPQFMMPIFMIYFILNSYIQDQTNWMDEGSRAIIVGIVKLLPGLNAINFSFDKSLLICALSGIFFHLGSFVFNKPIYNSTKDHIIFDRLRVVNGNKNLVIIFSIIISSIIWMPNYFIPNSGHGTFWTFPLALSVCFIPVAMLELSKIIFLFTLTIALLVANYVLTSKAAFAFIILPILIYYIFFYLNFLKIFKSKSFLKSFIILCLVFLTFAGSLFIGNQYGKLDAKKLLRRDYAFEIFAILVESKKLELINHEKSWIKNEIFEAFPSIVYKKKITKEHINPAKRVAIELFPAEVVKRPNTYWNRHMLFAGYYDLGIFGSLFSAFFHGLFLSYFWKLTKAKVKRYNAKWPILVYLPLPSFGVYFLSVGNLSYPFLTVGIAFIILLIIFYSARLRFN
jgi:hypothetical protein